MVTILRGKDLPYQLVQEGKNKKIINHFKLHLKNQTFEDALLQLKVSDQWESDQIEIISQKKDIKKAQNQVQRENASLTKPRTKLITEDKPTTPKIR